MRSSKKTIQRMLNGVERGWPPAQCLHSVEDEEDEDVHRSIEECMAKESLSWSDRVLLMSFLVGSDDGEVKPRICEKLSDGDVPELLKFMLDDNSFPLGSFGVSWQRNHSNWSFMDERLDLLAADIHLFTQDGGSWAPGSERSIHVETKIDGKKYYVEIILGAWKYDLIYKWACPGEYEPSRFLLALTGISFPVAYEWALFSVHSRQPATPRSVIEEAAERMKRLVETDDGILDESACQLCAGALIDFHVDIIKNNKERARRQELNVQRRDSCAAAREELDRERAEQAKRAEAALRIADVIKNDNAQRSAARKSRRRGIVTTPLLRAEVDRPLSNSSTRNDDDDDTAEKSKKARRKANKKASDAEKKVHAERVVSAEAARVLSKLRVEPTTSSCFEAHYEQPVHKHGRRPKKDCRLRPFGPMTKAESDALDLQVNLWSLPIAREL